MAMPATSLRLMSFAVLLGTLVTGCGQQGAETAASTEQTLRRGLGAEPETLDPQQAIDNAALAVVGDLNEGLTTESNDGSIVPGSALSWSVDPDKLRYTFRLREGLRWSNGDPLTSAHFVAGLEAARDPGAAAPNASLLDPIAGVTAAGPGVVRVELRRPVAYLPALLALPVAAPVHPSAARLTPRPGNGPYRVVRREPGAVIELERNPYYHSASDVAIARVSHVVVTDLTTELNLYRTGQLDMTSEVPNAQLAALRNALQGELRIAPYLGVYSYAFNLARLPERAARLALAMAVNRERITGQVTGAGELPAYGWIPDGIPGYSAARFEWRGLARREAGIRALELWRSANPPARIKLCTDASANHRRTAVALADMWRTALAVETEIVELEWGVYLDARRHPGDCDLVRLGWSADFVDPEAFAAIFESGHPQNTLGYASVAYDTLLARSRTATSAAARMQALAAAEAQLLDDAPVLPVFFRVAKRLVKPYVQGVTASPLGHVASRDLRVLPH